MVRELQLPLTTPHVISNNDDDEDGFLLQIANDIIVSHLSCHGYKYMLSTFYPEAAGINSDKVCKQFVVVVVVIIVFLIIIDFIF